MEWLDNKDSHLTAINREKPSFPLNYLLDKQRVVGTILDYGCGLGKDVEYLKQHGFDIEGYDKFYQPDLPSQKYDTILCTYVLNVLLQEQQSEVLAHVSELLNENGKAYFTVRRDIVKEGFRKHKNSKIRTYQTNVKLPFKSIFSNRYCEIYEYIHYNQINDKNSSCIFCSPRANTVLLSEMATVYSLYDKFPVSRGHALILPKRHTLNYFELSTKEQRAVWIMVNRVKDILTREFQPDGFNVGFNVNEAGGQTVFHTHVHVIPRYKNDTMNPRGGVRKVIPDKADYIQTS
ncbi:MAG: HIT domain-containing protein [Bernardetiaceae bacterium]|nr:HIT domain-containing protein [Bernardetiaceae bacterium]